MPYKFDACQWLPSIAQCVFFVVLLYLWTFCPVTLNSTDFFYTQRSCYFNLITLSEEFCLVLSTAVNFELSFFFTLQTIKRFQIKIYIFSITTQMHIRAKICITVELFFTYAFRMQYVCVNNQFSSGVLNIWPVFLQFQAKFSQPGEHQKF